MQMFDRAIRRHHLRRIKLKARRIMRGCFGMAIPTPKQVGIQAGTHCRACSCFLCQPGSGVPPRRERQFFHQGDCFDEAGLQ
jgi:hypothetical protein